MLALASVVPCAVLMEDGRRPQSVSRRTAVCHFCAAFRQMLCSLYHCPGLPNATLCRRTERHHTAACISQPTRLPDYDTAACPGGLLLGQWRIRRASTAGWLVWPCLLPQHIERVARIPQEAPASGTSQYGKPSRRRDLSWRGTLSKCVLPYRLSCSNAQYI